MKCGIKKVNRYYNRLECINVDAVCRDIKDMAKYLATGQWEVVKDAQGAYVLVPKVEVKHE